MFTYQRDGPAKPAKPVKEGTRDGRAKPGTPGIGVFSSSPQYAQNGAASRAAGGVTGGINAGFNAASRYGQNGANDLNTNGLSANGLNTAVEVFEYQGKGTDRDADLNAEGKANIPHWRSRRSRAPPVDTVDTVDMVDMVETEGKAGTENRETTVDTVEVVEEAAETEGKAEAVEAVETVAEATAGRLLPCLFRVVVGLSAFDATAVTEGGDKVGNRFILWLREIGLYRRRRRHKVGNKMILFREIGL